MWAKRRVSEFLILHLLLKMSGSRTVESRTGDCADCNSVSLLHYYLLKETAFPDVLKSLS